MNKLTSIMTMTDSYKGSMYKQYPPGTEYVYSYIESRGGIYDKTLFFGLQTFIKQYLLTPITLAQLEYAEKLWAANGMPFNKEDWLYIIEQYQGYLPLEIKAMPEGTVVPVGCVLVTVENTDHKLYWLTTWVETAILRAIWYPTTVATVSWHIKQVLKASLERSGDLTGLPFKLHDFGARGVSSHESACIGGAAHLVNFMGTDTIEALALVQEDYSANLGSIGYSIPASEHSTITSWGRENEPAAFANMLAQFGKPGSLLAVVSDSYNIYHACEHWVAMKDAIIASAATVVIRPDSGDPTIVLPKMLEILSEGFGYVVNSKGYKVLNNVRIIWGDGIDAVSLSSILRVVVDLLGYSADNFAFGMGGGLLQKLDRDTQKFAMKCSSIFVHDTTTNTYVDRDVYKDPITDAGKRSKKGRVATGITVGGEYYTTTKLSESVLDTVYVNGGLLIDDTFNDIRARSNEEV
jgi:nicotinamide phosphoribosyltransferase